MRSWRAALAGVAAALLCMAGSADDPADRLPNPAQEARARHLFQQLRCVVCQNESIDDSQAEIAGDLRKIVRVQITQCRSDQQVREGLKALFAWPTFPQLYVKGELVGGLDVLREMVEENPGQNLAQQLGLA